METSRQVIIKKHPEEVRLSDIFTSDAQLVIEWIYSDMIKISPVHHIRAIQYTQRRSVVLFVSFWQSVFNSWLLESELYFNRSKVTLISTYPRNKHTDIDYPDCAIQIKKEGETRFEIRRHPDRISLFHIKSESDKLTCEENSIWSKNQSALGFEEKERNNLQVMCANKPAKQLIKTNDDDKVEFEVNKVAPKQKFENEKKELKQLIKELETKVIDQQNQIRELQEANMTWNGPFSLRPQSKSSKRARNNA